MKTPSVTTQIMDLILDSLLIIFWVTVLSGCSSVLGTQEGRRHDMSVPITMTEYKFIETYYVNSKEGDDFLVHEYTHLEFGWPLIVSYTPAGRPLTQILSTAEGICYAANSGAVRLFRNDKACRVLDDILEEIN